MLDLPGAVENKQRFQNIEKNILLPKISTLSQEVVRESLNEEIRLAFLADGKSNEFIEKWFNEDPAGKLRMTNGVSIAIPVCYDMGLQKRGS
jgi:hypothetical protein